MMRVLLIMSFILLSGYPLIAQGSINVITYNIRLNTSSDGEHAWPNRKEDVISTLKFHKADIFCLQEVLHGQLMDVNNEFPGFDYVGVGRDDGIRSGEYSPVFYNTEQFVKVNSGVFWLSKTPEKPSLGWDAAYKRVCTWVKLEERESGKRFYIFNTHFDHIGEEARKNSAVLILDKIDKIAGGEPVILCGDFNLPPESVPIKSISNEMQDSFYASKLAPHGSVATFLGFTYDGESKSRIDYIFVSRDLSVLRYGALTDSRNRKFFSDHIPVLVEVDY